MIAFLKMTKCTLELDQTQNPHFRSPKMVQLGKQFVSHSKVKHRTTTLRSNLTPRYTPERIGSRDSSRYWYPLFYDSITHNRQKVGTI